MYMLFASARKSLAILMSLLIPSLSVIGQTLTEKPVFSVSHGFYTTAFDLVITSPLPNSKIRFTTDASDPLSSSTTLSSVSPCTVKIDPSVSYGVKGKTAGVTIRACIKSAEGAMGFSVTQTYLFLNKNSELSPDNKKPGTGWPNPQTSGTQSYNYGMDPDILNDPRYKDSIATALLSIPSISIVTDLKNLFSADSGIYANAYQDGELWERPASLELLCQDGSPGFQINAGLRIRGGASRDGSNPKHAFRFFFKGEYGEGKLNYPLFEDEGVKSFDKIDFRCGQNYSWSFPGHQGEYHTFTRDVFSRDLQASMGHQYTRSRYYHLYINGYYWGLYQTQERSEAKYAASYFGGSEENYDVIKSGDGWPSNIEATDGNFDAYRFVWDRTVEGFQTNANYFKLLGQNADGSSNPVFKKMVDIDNLIDYMLIIFFTGNFDGPITIWSNNKNPRNFYAIYDRTKNEGFRFWVHDAEHSIRTTAGEHPNTVGLQENRVNLGSLPSSNQFKMTVDNFYNFHPQWLHYRLSQNAEYKVRFADRVYKSFFNNGAITPAKTKALFMARVKQIEQAIIAESARWGDTYYHPARNKMSDWLPAVYDIVNNYFPVRPGIVLNQLKAEGLYPSVNPPQFFSGNQEIQDEVFHAAQGVKIVISKPTGSSGTVYYTINGADPRLIGGANASSAITANSADTITVNKTIIIKARMKSGSVWSALHQIAVFVGSDASKLKVTELHYHPLPNGAIDGEEFEFIELKNTGDAPIDLSNYQFINGITYNLGSSAILYPGKFIVFASNRQEFNNRYGFFPDGEYAGQLSNSGEQITMARLGGDTVISFVYDDSQPWPVAADGDGYSLVSKDANPSGNQNTAEQWRASRRINGSPGKDDDDSAVNINESVNIGGFILEQNYPNPFNAEARIAYWLPKQAKTMVEVFDVLGRLRAVLFDGELAAGKHEVVFDGAAFESGVYFYTVSSGNVRKTGKMVLLK